MHKVRNALQVCVVNVHSFRLCFSESAYFVVRFYGNGKSILSAGQDRAFRLFSVVQVIYNLCNINFYIRTLLVCYDFLHVCPDKNAIEVMCLLYGSCLSFYQVVFFLSF